jgi:hypothetical protein
MTDIIRRCGHCNNLTPHTLVNDFTLPKVYDEVDGEPVIEEFKYILLQCGTCSDLTLAGGFGLELPRQRSQWPTLYPESPDLPESVPGGIRLAYSEAARIRRQAPNAFAGQIRRALEAVCQDKNARGANLAQQLESLVGMSVIPPNLGEMTTLIRKLGNIGVHATGSHVSVWDAESIDDFFKSIVEYVYIAPDSVRRLRDRLERSSPSHAEPPANDDE